MGLARRLAEGALKKIDELGERDQARALAKLTPAERERYDLWVERTKAIQEGGSVEQLGDPLLTATVLQGSAGEAVHGVGKPPRAAQAIEDQDAWERQAAVELAVRDEARSVPVCAYQRRRRVKNASSPTGHVKTCWLGLPHVTPSRDAVARASAAAWGAGRGSRR
jgi:hypothetical protein